MKEFQIRVKDGSKATDDAMKELSKGTQNVWKEFLKGNGTVSDVASTVVGELQGMEDQILAGQLAVSLFGVKWEDLESDAMYAMLGSQEAMKGFEGAMQKVNDVRFDTFGKAVQGIGRILFMDLVYPLGEAALPALNKTASFLKDNLPGAITSTLAALKAITPVVLGIVSAMLVYHGTLFAISAATTMLNAVQKISIALYHAHRAAMIGYSLAGGGVKGVIAGIRAAMVALNITMLANPFVAVAAAVVGLTVAFIAAYKMSDRFRAAVDNAFAVSKDFVVNSAKYIATNAVTIWDGLIKSARELPSRLQSALSGSMIGKMMSNLFSNSEGIMDGLINSIKAGFSSIPGILSMVAPMLTTLGLSFLGVSGPIGLLIGAIVSIGGFLFRLSQTNEGVASALKSAWESVASAFAPIMQVFADGFAQFSEEVGPQLSETMQVISESIVALGPSFAELGATLGEAGTLLIGAWAEVATVVAATALPALLQVFQTVFPMIVSIVTTVVPLVAQVLTSIIPIILNLAQMIIPLILMVVQQVFPVILAIIQAVLPIVAQLLITVVQVILQLASTVLPILLQVVQMVFPVVLQIIQMVIPIIVMVLQTLVAVINGVIIPAINGILAVIQFVFPYVQMIIQNALAIVNGIIQTAMALLRGDWDGAWNAIKGTAETIMNNIISFFQGINLFEVGKSIITGLINGIKSMGGKILGAITDMIPAPIRGATSKLLGKLPGFAQGGVVSAPTLAWIGEGGDTETVIPWNNSDRSKQLWLQTGQALGMFGDAGLLSGIQQQANNKNVAPTASNIRPSQVRPSNQGGAPVQIIQEYYVTGNNVEEMKQVVNEGNESLLSKLQQIEKDRRRLEFG